MNENTSWTRQQSPARMIKRDAGLQAAINANQMTRINFCLALMAAIALAKCPAAAAFDLKHCTSALGMESGAIADKQITASSSYDITITGPASGRLNINRHGGAWCPREPVGSNDSVKQYLQIDLGSMHVISAVETQGRFGNGVGVEFVETFMLEYWRPGFSDWRVYRLYTGDKILPGNVNTYSPERRTLSPPILATMVRFVPHSTHQRTVCMRVELLGCPYLEGVMSYSGQQGSDRGTELLLQDATYDGSSSEGRLHGGVGQLVDGVVGGHNFRTDLGHGRGYEWVGWRNDTERPVELVFEFDTVRNFSHVFIFTNNMFSKDVQVFSEARVWLSIGGEFYSYGPLVFRYMPDAVSEHARNVSVLLAGSVAKFVKIQLFFADKWILVSEVYFNSTIAAGNFTKETEADTLKGAGHADANGNGLRFKVSSNGYLHDGTPVGGTLHKNLVVTDLTGGSGGQEHVALIIGVLVAVICLLVSAILLICWRARRQKAGHITHDVYTGPFGEKRDVVNLKGKSGLYSEPYQLAFSSLVGYPRLQGKDSSLNRLSSPDYTVPHVNSSAVEEEVLYAPPLLPHNKAPYQGPFASFMSKHSLLGSHSNSSSIIANPLDNSSANLTSTLNSRNVPGTLNRNLGEGNSPAPTMPSSRPGALNSSTLGSTLGGTLGSTPAGSSGATVSSTSGGSTNSAGALQQEENFYATTEIIEGRVGGGMEREGDAGEEMGVVMDDSPPKEIPQDKISLLQKLGEGQFGEVHLGEVTHDDGHKQMVAVKTLRLEASNSVRCGFEREVQILAKLRDPNIVGVVGVSTKEEPLCLLVEYLEHGDLYQYLQARVVETTRVTQAQTISYGCLIYIATQIASGMKYLEALNFVHRDLATRNCLVGANNIIKISDFGMSRAVYAGDYYRTEGAGLLPIRWMAWESAMLGKYTTKSDVWSFAVTLWEVLGLAREQPYEELSDLHVLHNLAAHYHNDARKMYLPPPSGCPKEIYELMKECWRRNDVDRPSFREIHMFLLRKNLGYSPIV